MEDVLPTLASVGRGYRTRLDYESLRARQRNGIGYGPRRGTLANTSAGVPVDLSFRVR
jgi:hypothetical protein